MSGNKESSKRTEGQKRLAGRRRYWATVLYQDSEASNWYDILVNEHIQCLISPLHDQDIADDGTPKKAHRHVLLVYDSVKARDQVLPLVQAIHGVGIEEIASLKSYARYLCHLDNKDKHRYPVEQVEAIGGIEYETVIHMTSDDSRDLSELFEFIRVNQILSYAELVDLTATRNKTWFNLAIGKGFIVERYIKSLAWEIEHGYTRKDAALLVSPATGEVLE